MKKTEDILIFSPLYSNQSANKPARYFPQGLEEKIIYKKNTEKHNKYINKI